MSSGRPSISRRGVLASAASVVGAGCASPLELNDSDSVDVTVKTPWGGLGGQRFRPEASPPRRNVETLWEDNIFGFSRTPATPVAIDGLIYYPSKVALEARNPNDGNKEWTLTDGEFFSPPGFVTKTPHTNGSMIVTYSTGVRGIDPDGGVSILGQRLATRWQYPPNSRQDPPPISLNHDPIPVIDGTRAYITLSNRYAGVVGANAASGSIDWHFNGSEDEEYHRPAVSDGRVFVTDFHDGVWALDGETGDVHWSKDLPERGILTPIAAGGTVYVANWAGVFAFDAKRGTRRWRRRPTTKVGGMALGDGVLYFGTEGKTDRAGRIVALDVESREVLWEQRGSVSGPPVVAGDTLLVPLGETLAAFDVSDGSRLWSTKLTDPMAPPLVFRGRVFVAAGNRLFAIGGQR